jgi:hypothetical protein
MNSPLYLIGLAGYKQSGKDTAAELLRREFRGLEYHRIGLFDTGKEEVAKILGTTVAQLEANKNTPLVRHILQWYGQEQKEKEGLDVWVKKAAEKINSIKNCKPQLFIVTDCRFQVEADWIRSIGGLIVKLERYDSSDDMHSSEQEVTRIRGDYYLRNKGTLLDLQRETKWIAQYLKEKWKMV